MQIERKPTEVKTGRLSCCFLIFAFSLFLNFKLLLPKTYNRFRVFLENHKYVTNIFDLHIFDKETATLLNFVEICIEIYFVSYFFQMKETLQPPF